MPDPSTLAGKVLWLRAKDLTAGTVTTWPDQSGCGNDATGSETAVAASTPLGGMAVSALASKFGVSDSVESVAKAIAGDPQAAQKIAEMELEFAKLAADAMKNENNNIEWII